MAAELQWRAMGSDAHVIVVGGPPGLAERARDRVEELEGRWSRFREDSEISVLNRSAGHPVHVSPDTITLIQRATAAWSLSGGAYDPTLLTALVDAGYDRSFELVGPASGGCSPEFDPLRPGVDALEVDGNMVRLPAGSGFDPGGIGKGLAADLVVALLLESGADGACVNLGGDLRVSGLSPTGDGWTAAVQHPWSVTPLVHLGLADGAVATSTTLRRRWHVDGEVRHHLIDPQTGRPSDTDVNLATVVAGTAWEAEVLAKAVVLAGFAHPFDILGGTGVEGLAVSDQGQVATTPGFSAYTGGAVLAGALVTVAI
jgi:thiamine biosynthesis lipoprotein